MLTLQYILHSSRLLTGSQRSFINTKQSVNYFNRVLDSRFLELPLLTACYSEILNMCKTVSVDAQFYFSYDVYLCKYCLRLMLSELNLWWFGLAKTNVAHTLKQVCLRVELRL